jgi:hypothetical protein
VRSHAGSRSHGWGYQRLAYGWHIARMHFCHRPTRVQLGQISCDFIDVQKGCPETLVFTWRWRPRLWPNSMSKSPPSARRRYDKLPLSRSREKQYISAAFPWDLTSVFRMLPSGWISMLVIPGTHIFLCFRFCRRQDGKQSKPLFSPVLTSHEPQEIWRFNQTSTSPCPLSVADFRGTSTVATKPEGFGWNAGPSLLELISFIGAVRTSQVAYLSPVSASGPKDKGSGK